SHKAFLKPNSYITDVKDEFSYKFGGGTFFQIERFVFSAAYSYSKTLNSAIEFSIAYGHTGTSVVRYIK
ncbi:MAG: hypothetical protein IIT58_09785, partial [Treponema sp.]|nr:hypothetical protein [Treponema sp.]